MGHRECDLQPMMALPQPGGEVCLLLDTANAAISSSEMAGRGDNGWKGTVVAKREAKKKRPFQLESTFRMQGFRVGVATYCQRRAAAPSSSKAHRGKQQHTHLVAPPCHFQRDQQLVLPPPPRPTRISAPLGSRKKSTTKALGGHAHLEVTVA